MIISLRDGPGRPGVASVQEELGTLELIRRLELQTTLFDHAPVHGLERYRRRIVVETPISSAATRNPRG
jgi:hypothetical protein